jgi:hypothetical protein
VADRVPNGTVEYRPEPRVRVLWLGLTATFVVTAVFGILTARSFNTPVLANNAFCLAMAAYTYRFGSTRLVVGADGLLVRGLFRTTRVGWASYVRLGVHQSFATSFRSVAFVMRTDGEPVRVYALYAPFAQARARRRVVQVADEIEDLRARSG